MKSKKWTTSLLDISVVVLMLDFIGLNFHAYSGGLYETKTMGAMVFRIVVTVVFSALPYFL